MFSRDEPFRARHRQLGLVIRDEGAAVLLRGGRLDIRRHRADSHLAGDTGHLATQTDMTCTVPVLCPAPRRDAIRGHLCLEVLLGHRVRGDGVRRAQRVFEIAGAEVPVTVATAMAAEMEGAKVRSEIEPQIVTVLREGDGDAELQMSERILMLEGRPSILRPLDFVRHLRYWTRPYTTSLDCPIFIRDSNFIIIHALSPCEQVAAGSRWRWQNSEKSTPANVHRCQIFIIRRLHDQLINMAINRKWN